MARQNRGVLLRSIVACGWAVGAIWQPSALAADYPPDPPFTPVRSLTLQYGPTFSLGGYAFSAGPPSRYAFAVYWSYADGRWPSSESGGALVPIWGYYEFADALAVQPDGKIVVGGNAADPVSRADPACHPAFCRYYPALIRLNADGSVDPSFNGNGKIVLAIGNANSGPEVADLGTLTDIALEPGGKILVYSGATAVARVNSDGTLDKSFVATSQVAREYASSYQGLWWNAGGTEPGWGLALSQQGDVIFAVWLNYDAAGKARWLSVAANRTGEGSYAGTLYETRGPAFSRASFDPANVQATAVGSATLAFDDANTGTFAYTVDGVSGTKAITRQAFGPPPLCALGAKPPADFATNYQDLWWAAPGGSESGWGLELIHQGDTIFAIWLTYDVDGTPLWLSGAASMTGPEVFAGTLYRTTGPAFAAMPFDPTKVNEAPVGTLKLTFADDNAGTFTYTVGSVTGSKPITRQVFGAPATRCQ